MEVCALSSWDKSRIPIRVVTTRHSLFPSSHTRFPNSFPCGLLAFLGTLKMAENRAYHVPIDIDATDFGATNCLGPISPPVIK